MKSLFFLLFGLITGGIIMLFIMCCLEINRINAYEKIIKSYKN